MAINIIKKITNHGSQNGTNYPTWIVIHETDNEDIGADALCHARALGNGNLSCSAHYYVDENNIVQVHEHWTVASHVGIKYGTPQISGIGNRNSIGIEICVNKDGNYSKARQNAIKLTKYLISTMKIPANRVVRHYDACKKYCPRKMLNDSSLWNDFKQQIRGNVHSFEELRYTVPMMQGERVVLIQNILKKLKYLKGNVDGYFGADTQNAVLGYQKDHKFLNQRAIVDEATWKSIMAHRENNNVTAKL